jgi:hypothetical protein
MNLEMDAKHSIKVDTAWPTSPNHAQD